jgi:cell division septation protein DedD
MRNMRRINEKFEFSLDGRQISLLFFLIVLLIGLSFSIGVMYGRGLRKIEKPAIVAQQEKPEKVLPVPEQEQNVEQPPSTPSVAATPGKSENYTFYESLTKETPPPGIEPAGEKQKEVVLPSPSDAEEKTKAVIPQVEMKKETKESKETVKPSSKGEYSIQVIAYNDRDKARSMVKKLKTKGFNAFIEEGKAGGKKIFRVKIGYYDTREEAEGVARELKKKEGLTGFITK